MIKMGTKRNNKKYFKRKRNKLDDDVLLFEYKGKVYDKFSLKPVWKRNEAFPELKELKEKYGR